MDGELSKVFIDIQFDPKRLFMGSPENQKYQGIPKSY